MVSVQIYFWTWYFRKGEVKMKIEYIDHELEKIQTVECIQVVFTLDKDNVVCFRTKNESIKDSLKVPKKDVRWVTA